MRWSLLSLLFIASTAFAEIPVNTWVNMEPEVIQPPEGTTEAEVRGSGPKQPQVSEDNEEPDYRAYSTLEAGEDGRVYYFGGGHHNYAGNDVDIYHPAANTWTQFTEEENWRTDCDEWANWGCEKLKNEAFAGGPRPSEPTPRGRPWTEHTYQHQVWVPNRDQLCVMAMTGEWCYDATMGDKNGAWTRLSDVRLEASLAADPGGMYPQTAVGYSPALETRVAFINGPVKEVRKYNRGTQTWERIGIDLIFVASWGEVFSEYSPDHKQHLVVTNENKGKDSIMFQLVDIPNRDVIEIKPLWESFPNYEPTDTYEYSPELKKFLIFGDKDGSNEYGLFTYDPESDEWGRIHLDGTKPSNVNLNWDLFERDPQTGRYIFLRLHPVAYKNPLLTYNFRLDESVTSNKPTPCPMDACVGDGFQFGSIQNAVDSVDEGGKVGLADQSFNQCAVISKSLTLKALSGRPHMQNKICNSKGVLVNKAPGTVTVEGLEISGADSVKAVWQHNTSDTMILRNVKVHDSGMGIFSAPGAESLQVYDSELWNMHDRNEWSHFIYGAESNELIVKGTYLHGGTDGHFIKAQSVNVVLENNTIRQEVYTDINLIDVWGCGDNTVRGNDIRSADTWEGVHAIGITTRKGGDTPCPVNRASFLAEGNRYEKLGSQKWSTFVVNRYDPLMGASLVLKNNTISNAWLIRDSKGNRMEVGEYEYGSGNKTGSADTGDGDAS